MLKYFCLLAILFFNFPFCSQMPILAQDYEEQLIRVGISTKDFSLLEYPSTSVSATGNFIITDLSDQKILVNATANAVYKVSVDPKGFNIDLNGKRLFSEIQGPIGFNCTQGYIKLPDLLRAGKVPLYRGSMEVVRASNVLDKLSVVNLLPFDDYLKGVVPNELPVSFGLEALKAQAVAARNYAIRPRVKPYSQFDICDSVMCQVYFGYGTEKALSTDAVNDTAGLVALYNGEVIIAVYSSASGGCSESYEFAFSDPESKSFPAESMPYLTSKCDMPGFSDLSNEDEARKFYTSMPESHDVKSSYYRWNRSWTPCELVNVLDKNLFKLSEASESKPFVSPVFDKSSKIGTLKDIIVSRRGKSGKAMDLKIIGSNGSWVVQKELNIRRLLTKDGKALPSANIIVDVNKDENDDAKTISILGGGFGHGVGMSQYGASYMASKGHSFKEILQHYYSGVSIGTVPVFLVGADYVKPVKQVFSAPNGTAELYIENEGVDSIKLIINNKEVIIDNVVEGDCKSVVDISQYLNKGLNEVIFFPPDPEVNEGLSVKMWVEVFKAKKDV